MIAPTLLVSAVLVGAVGGVHCTAMCGGFVAAITARERGSSATVPLLSAGSLARRQAAYHAGRIATYGVLGALAGAGGGAALQAADALAIQRPLYLIANLMLLLVATAVALNLTARPGWQHAGGRVFARAAPLFQPFLRRGGWSGRLALGALWGLVPCALIYSALPLALFSGGAPEGAAVMVAFGIGTLPWLTLTGFVFDRLGAHLRSMTVRYLVGAVIATFAIAGIHRALLAPQMLGSGPFCLLP